MYTLTLTSGERQAFDFASWRYASYAIYNLLAECMGEDDEWSSGKDITFQIPEHISWAMQDIRDRNGMETWTLFSDDLTSKMERFLDSII